MKLVYKEIYEKSSDGSWISIKHRGFSVYQINPKHWPIVQKWRNSDQVYPKQTEVNYRYSIKLMNRTATEYVDAEPINVKWHRN